MTAPHDTGRILNTAEMTQAVWRHFAGQAWAGLTEVATPRRDSDSLTAHERKARRIDLLFVRHPKRPDLGDLERLAVEVKVSRSDFLRDVANQHKQAPWRELAHRHAYAVPKGLVHPAEIPADCGLLYVSEMTGYSGHVTFVVEWEKNAPYTDTRPDVPPFLITTMASRASWAEARSRGWVADFSGQDLAAITAERDALRAELAARDALPIPLS